MTCGLPWGSVVMNLTASAGDVGSIPGMGRSPGEGNGNPFQSSRQENPMDKGPWWATVHRVSQNWSDQHFHFTVMNIKWYWH